MKKPLKKAKPPSLKEQVAQFQESMLRACREVSDLRRQVAQVTEERDWLRSIVTGTTVSRTGRPDVVLQAMQQHRR